MHRATSPPQTLTKHTNMTNAEQADQLELAAKILREGLEWEMELTNGWHHGSDCGVIPAINGGYPIRIKPKPKHIPWTFATRPMGVVWVHMKESEPGEIMINAWRHESVDLGIYPARSYQDLFDHWLQRDGTPCGTLEETP